MANNNLEFSEQISNLTDDEVAWWKAEFERVQNSLDFGVEDGNEDYDPWEDIENCNNFEVQEHAVWFRSDESGDVEKVAHIIQKFLKKFRPKECFCLTWSEHCSKLRLGEFGGGGVFVTAEDQKWVSAHGFVEDQQKAWKAWKESALNNPDSA